MAVAYLLDANVLITAQRDYYPIDRVPQFWDWIAHHAKGGKIKIPRLIWSEITPHDSDLETWMKAHKEILILDPDNSDSLVSNTLNAYAPDLTEEEIEKIGQDPFLIAAAEYYDATVVSKEGSKPSAQRANRKIPDICTDLGVKCITDYQLIRELDFRI